MISSQVQKLIRKILEKNSGGIKMVALVTALYTELQAIGKEKLEVCTLFDSLEAMEDVETLEYMWHGKIKEFVYLNADGWVGVK